MQETKPLFLPQILKAGSTAEELWGTGPENRNADEEPQLSIQVIRHLPISLDRVVCILFHLYNQHQLIC